ncbi:hypothetical protein D3C76_1020510 [compost metagenome]
MGPFPGKQADPLGLLDAQCLAGHQAGYRAAGVQAAGDGLYMVSEAPVELALYHQVPWLGQALRNGADLAGRVGPVLTMHTIAATDRLGQQAIAVNQGHRHAVDLGLGPDLSSTQQPMLDGTRIWQFFQAGMRHWMGQRTARGAQWIGSRAGTEALAPLGQSCEGLIVEFVGDQRTTFTVIAVIPEVDLFLQRGEFLCGTRGRPGRAFASSTVQAQAGQE